MYAPKGDEEAGGGTAPATHCGGGTGGGAPARPSFVMPFALLSASSMWTWVGLKNDGFFDGDQVWDQE
jgi:hypothetical protein